MRTVVSIAWLALVAGVAGALPPSSIEGFPAYPGARLMSNEVEGWSRTVVYEAGVAAGPVVAYHFDAFGLHPEGSEPELIPFAFWMEGSVQCMVFFREGRTPTFPWAKGVATVGQLKWETQDGNGNQSVAMMGQLAAVNPAQERIVNEIKANPPTARELAERVRSLYGVPLYPGATLQLRVMEIYAFEMWGGLESYWFLSRDLPDKVVAYYEMVTGNRAYQKDFDMAFYVDISNTARQITCHVAVYQGTTAVNLNQEPGDADPEEVWYVSSIGFYKTGEPVEPTQEESAGGR